MCKCVVVVFLILCNVFRPPGLLDAVVFCVSLGCTSPPHPHPSLHLLQMTTGEVTCNQAVEQVENWWKTAVWTSCSNSRQEESNTVTVIKQPANR